MTGELGQRHSDHAIHAVRHLAPNDGNREKHLGDAKRNHCEGDTRNLRDDKAECCGEGCDKQLCHQQNKHEITAHMQGEIARGVSRKPERGGMSERHQTGITDQEVEAHRPNRENHGLGHQRDGEGGRSHEGERGERDGQRERLDR